MTFLGLPKERKESEFKEEKYYSQKGIIIFREGDVQ